ELSETCFECSFAFSFSSIGLPEQRSRDEIQHSRATLRHALWRQRIGSGHHPHHRCIGEIKNNHCNHGGNKLQRVNVPELTGNLSRFQQFRDFAEQRTKILVCYPLQLRTAATASAHHFALNNSRVGRT